MNDIDYMKQAMTLALRGKGKTSPNPMVGALVVKGKKIIARGWHRYCGGDHAEVDALKKAGAKAKGAVLYVTLEPCLHYGRTPPCVDRILASGIREVIVGMKDPNPVNNGKSIGWLRKHGIKTKVGFLENDLRKMNEVFLKYITQEMPFVVAKSAQTLDGKIATASGQSKWITSPTSRDYAHRLRNDFDAILVGVKTILKDNPRLNAARKSKRIKKVIVDSKLKLPLSAKVFQGTHPEDIFVATTRNADKKKMILLNNKGVNVIMGPSFQGRVNFKWLFEELAKKEITSILIEGGAHTIGGALNEHLIDKFLIFMAPKILGDARGLSSVRGLTTTHVDQSVRLRDLTIQRIKEDILIEAYVHRDH